MSMNESVTEFVRILNPIFLCPLIFFPSFHLLLCKSWGGSGGGGSCGGSGGGR